MESVERRRNPERVRVALVHDWLIGMRGGEKVFEVLCQLFPHADVYTLFYLPDRVSPLIRSMRVKEPLLTRLLPPVRRHHRWMLPLMPSMIEALPVRGYDLIISTSHAVAKGVLPDPQDTPHVCYCFTPMRYVWEKYDDYFRGGGLATLPMKLLRRSLQEWDVESSKRVRSFITSSNYVRERIRRHYLREALVLPPPVECERFRHVERSPEKFYLVAGALEPYKRVDIVIEAFRRLGLPLKIAGSGSLARKFTRNLPDNVEMLGWVDNRKLGALYSCARALIFPADEDFGIVPLEAAASGCPAIAYRHGGSLETIVENVTGTFFNEQTPEAVADAVIHFDPSSFNPDAIRAHAEPYDLPLFRAALRDAIASLSGVPGLSRSTGE
jgi:glycosyltransferase involved in cell wall biosynthesis